MDILRNEDVTMLQTPNGNATGVLASPKEGATEVLVLRQRQQPGGQNPPHRHDREEVMIGIAGTVTVTVDDVPAQLSAGDTLIVPAATLHRVANTGDSPAEWLLIATAGLRFFSPTGEEIRPAFLA